MDVFLDTVCDELAMRYCRLCVAPYMSVCHCVPLWEAGTSLMGVRSIMMIGVAPLPKFTMASIVRSRCSAHAMREWHSVSAVRSHASEQ